MNSGLKNKVALIGGSSDGLGLACAIGLAREGARVAICGRNAERLELAFGQLRKVTDAENIFSKVADWTKQKELDEWLQGASQQWGRVDILVNNTGGPPPGTFFEHDDARWQAAYELLLLPVVRSCRFVTPLMRNAGGGRIINITSVVVKEPSSRLILSSVYRSAVTSLGKVLSRDLAKDNILVNTICPGLHDTARLKQLHEDAARVSNKPFEEVRKGAVGGIPLGRLGTPGELANMVVFLASDLASNVTGTVIQVDGGSTSGLF